MTARPTTTIRFPPEVVKLRDAIAAHFGISKSAVVVMAIRELARKAGVKA